ncbi:ABC transporter ATP-binding protein [Phytomonospora sp. NPDC050363]|uniref:ABC transporter ATP-binding protein n=1 Tax=Phytomonospora sp. NPDC050363 TaxID=3155642 RepID=UPI0033CC38DC
MLDVREVSVELGGRTVVDKVALTAAPGEWVTVIGPNGAGKSTLLRAVAGLVAHDGDITVGGRTLADMRPRERARRVAMVHQQPVVPPGMSVADYVLLGRTPHIPPLGREGAADHAAVDSVLSTLDLHVFAQRRLETLSGGERQRVFLARALAQGAELLLLDEPTTALDIGHQQEVLDLVDGLRATGGLTVLSTMHDLSIAGEYADRLILLAEGRLVADGLPREVLTEANLAEHYRARVRVVEVDGIPVIVPIRGRQR